MDVVGSLLDRVCELLRESPTLDAVEILPAYPGGYRPQPLRKPALLVGIRELALLPGALGDYLGSGGKGESFGKRIEATLLFDLLFPPLAGAMEMIPLAEAVCQRLVLDEDGILEDIRWEEAKEDRSAGGLFMRMSGSFRALVTRTEQAGEIREITIIWKG